MAASRCGVGSLGAVVAIAITLSAAAGALALRAVALLELLAAPAPARIVAAHLVLVVDDALLHHGHGLRLLALVGARVGLAHDARRGRGGGQGSGAHRAVPAGV